MRDSNFELKKTQNEPVIEMQKAQSFEQPSDNFLKSKMQNKKYEVSQLKDCNVELIGRASLTLEKETHDDYDNNKKTFTYKYQGKKNNNDILQIPKPNNIDLNKTNKNNKNLYKFKYK